MSDAIARGPVGRRGLSEALRKFTGAFPHERGPILDFVMEVAGTTHPGARVLDLGAGGAPYRELFRHTRYLTNDWRESPHAGGPCADIVASAESLPVPDASFDLVFATQVLEHVPDPCAVVDECFRVLAPQGRVALTAPLFWELHEVPHDYYRYTDAGLRHMLARAGFLELQVVPRGDGFTSLAQLMMNLSWAMGDAQDGLTANRAEARDLLQRLAVEIAALAPLDVQRIMPLGYTATARKP